MHSVRLGTLFGFEINIDWSWLLIFALVVYTLASGYFPSVYPGFNPATSWLMGIIAALMLFASVLIHEISHSVVARNYGIEVKGITLFLFGGVSQTTEEPKSAREEFWMAIAGPATSFGLAVFFFLAGNTARLFALPTPLVAICGYLAMINGLLGVFNLVPGFPLDGGRVLRSIIWAVTGNLTAATQIASTSGQLFGYMLMAIGFLRIISADLIGGLWLIFIGWFLTGAARSSYQQLLVRNTLSGIRVEQVMTTDVPVIPADTSIRQFVNESLLKHEFSCYPVVTPGDGVVLGVIGAEEVRTVPSAQWDSVTIGEIAHKIDDAYEVKADDDAWDAMAKLATQDVCRLLVMEDGHLKGTVSSDSLFRLIQTKMRLGV